jgi:hypothetical protein
MIFEGLARLPTWLFLLLLVIASGGGFLVLGVTAAAISEHLIVPAALAGLLVPPFLMIVRRRKGRSREAPPVHSFATREARPRHGLDVHLEAGGDHRDDRINRAGEDRVHQTVAFEDTASERRWWKSKPGRIGSAVLVTLAVIVFLATNARHSDLGLKVEMQKGRGINGVLITNARTKPIRVLSVLINDRPNCAFSGGKANPAELKMGDHTFELSSCDIIQATVITDRGSATYTFK